MGFSKQIQLAGFGGQGILFAGKFLAYAGLLNGREVSWLPSYGPEMRGGTAYCSVILSDTQIGSPIITEPDILIALNLPSLDKFEGTVISGGQILADSSLIRREIRRDDVEAFTIPATSMASEADLEGLANMIMIGKLIRESDLFPYDDVPRVMEKVVPAGKKHLFDLNLKAIELGYEYGG